MRELNLLAPKGRFQFGYLVYDALSRAGVKVNWWDYRTNTDYRVLLSRTAPNLVLRGEAIQPIAHALEWLKGRRILWATEDIAKDNGAELLATAAYYDEILIHWGDPNTLDALGKIYPRKPVKVRPILYADQDVWKMPDGEDFTKAYHAAQCEVLHFGSMTPRREKIIAGMRLGAATANDGIVCYEIADWAHHRLARLALRSKCILNLHAWSDCNFEIRLAEALSLGAFVVTESLPGEPIVKEMMDAGVLQIIESGDIRSLVEYVTLMSRNYWEMRALQGQAIYDWARPRLSHLNIARDLEADLWG